MLWAQVLVNGILLGGIYACLAVGFSLVWGVLNVINMLHGSLIVLGAYTAIFAYSASGIHPLLLAPAVGVAVGALGYFLQRGLINRVMGRAVLVTLLVTFGLNLILDNLMIVAFSADFRRLVLDQDLGSINMGFAIAPVDRLLAMAGGIMLVLALGAMLRFTQFGRAIVAVRADRDAASLMGINIVNVAAYTFAVGAFMAGAAGTLLSTIFPVSPTMSHAYLAKAFVVCILGGLGSIPGVLAGGLVLGIVESYAGLFLGSEHGLTAAFLLVLIIMVARPSGLFGRRGFE